MCRNALNLHYPQMEASKHASEAFCGPFRSQMGQQSIRITRKSGADVSISTPLVSIFQETDTSDTDEKGQIHQ